MEPSFTSAFKQIIDFLEKCENEKGIKYYLVGGILASIYTTFRVTQDIDFVIDIQAVKMNIEDYITHLRENNFVSMQDWKTTELLAKDTKIIQFLDINETVKFDNYIIDKFNKSKYKRIGPIALERRERATLFDLKCWIVSKEDFILSKLVYGGWQDYSDALGCWMRFKEKLDISYLEITSKILEIHKEFELLRSGIGDPDDFFKEINSY